MFYEGLDSRAEFVRQETAIRKGPPVAPLRDPAGLYLEPRKLIPPGRQGGRGTRRVRVE